jgi:hypothetical protein
MRCMKWQELFSSLSSVFVYGRHSNGNEVSATEAPPAELCARSSQGAMR